MEEQKEGLNVDGLKALRAPFDPKCYGKLPRGNIKIDYVGHANVTDRLLNVDPHWNWEPLATDEGGLPRFERSKDGFPFGLWIKLTVCGMTRLGYGSLPGESHDPVKELIGDAIRNAAMRFGVALDLWAKEELESEVGASNVSAVREAKRAAASPPSKPPGQSTAEVQAQDARSADVTRENARMAGEVDAWTKPEDEGRFQAEDLHEAPSAAEVMGDTGGKKGRTTPAHPDFEPVMAMTIPAEVQTDVRVWQNDRFKGGKHKGKDWTVFLNLRPSQPDEADLFGYLRWMVNKTAQKIENGERIYKDDWYAVVVMQRLAKVWSTPKPRGDAMHAVASTMFGASDTEGENEASRYD